MNRPPSTLFSGAESRVQNKTTFLLLLNHAINASTGIMFWLLFIHLVGLDVSAIGLGYTVVAVGTAVGLVAKGGLGTAIMRHVPKVGAAAGRRLLGLGILAGASMSILFIAVAATLLTGTPLLPQITTMDWVLATLIAVFLIVAWLQDAYFLARGRPGATVWRNTVFSGAKLLIPIPLLWIAAPSPVAAAWAAALFVAALTGLWMVRRANGPRGRIDHAGFFRSAWRNVLGNAAEFLPGLLLVPLVLMVSGAQAAGYFGMAWTAASLLFLGVTAISRSALAQMVRGADAGRAVRRALAQASIVIVPGVVGATVLAPFIMGIFGADYAVAATPAFMILCASAFVVLPVYVYLDVLRAREEAAALNAFPLAIILFLFTLAPILTIRFGVTGTALAWFAANVPFGIWATVRLRHIMKEVETHATPNVNRHPHLE